MNKTKIALAATGGTLALIALALAVLTFLAYSDRTAALEGDDETEGLETAVSRVATLMGKKPFPSQENRKRIEENGQLLEECRARLLQEASRGDWCPDRSCGTPAQFKELIAREAKTLAALKGAGREPLLKPEFGFGPFKEYLADKMPTGEQLRHLQRQWFDITSLIDLLSTNGVIQVTDLQLVEAKAEQPEKSAAKKKAQRKNAAKEAARAESRKPSVETYKVTFLAAPTAFVDVVRELSFQERFTVVESFGFVRARDTIAEALGGGEKKEAAPAAGGRRRRRAAAVEQPAEESKEQEKKDAVVFDPETDATLNAELVVSVYDFRTLEEDEKGDEK